MRLRSDGWACLCLSPSEEMVKAKENTGKVKRPLIVMKFGGTSVGSPERMQGVAEILEEHSRQADVVAVVSAMGGATNMLIRAATQASQGQEEPWKGSRQELARRHREVADQ